MSIVVTTTLLINSYPAVHRNTEATPNDATTMNTQINLLQKKFFIRIGIITKKIKMIDSIQFNKHVLAQHEMNQNIV